MRVAIQKLFCIGWLVGVVPTLLYAGISRPCRMLLYYQTLDPTFKINTLMRLVPQKQFSAPDVPTLPHYADALVVYKESEIIPLAKQIAHGLGLEDFSTFEQRLRTAKVRGAVGVSLTELIHDRVAQRLGTFACDRTYHCYRAALNFHTALPFEHVRGVGPLIEDLPNYILDRYHILSATEELQFGDLIFFFKRLPPTGEAHPYHVVIYLGGDLVYHKFGPDVRMPFEITTLEAVADYYFRMAELGVDEQPGAQDSRVPMQMSFFRYNR